MSPSGSFGYWAPPGFWALVILAISSLPGVELEYLSFHWGDKTAHFAEYAVLGVLLGRLSRVSRIKRRSCQVGSLVLGIGLAGVDELHQLFIPNRLCEWGDFLFDAAGVCTGLVAYILFMRMRR
ncbi:MAG: VanZ family protein [bacterium]